VTAGPSGSLYPNCEPFVLSWLKKEFSGHLPPGRRELLLKNFNIQGPYCFVRNEHFTSTLIEAITKSNIKFRTILNDSQGYFGLCDDASFPQHDNTDLMVSAFQSLYVADSLIELHTINLNSQVMQNLQNNTDETTLPFPSAAPLLNALFTGAPRLKHLHLEGWLWRLDGAVADLTCIPKLELLSLSRMNVRPDAVLALVTPSLTMLRLHELSVLDPQTELPPEGNEPEIVVWHHLLPRIVDRASLKTLELRDVSAKYDANTRALSQALPSVAKKVPFVAQRSICPYEDPQYYAGNPEDNKVL
jgi:hypothetical protein